MLTSGEAVLIICYTFPPARGIGGRRWVKFAKELARRGHPVHVIAAELTPGRTDSPWSADANTPGIMVHRLPKRYPTVLVRRPLTSIAEKLGYRFWMRILPLITKGNPLDPTCFWRGQLLRKARELMADHDIRTVFVTGAPFRLLHHACGLAAPGIRLVGDLRDPWAGHDSYGKSMTTARRKQEEEAFEAEVMERSHRITSPSAVIINDLKRRYPGSAKHFFHLPHAVDPDELDVPLPPDGRTGFRAIYAGSLYGAQEAERYFSEVIKAFTTLHEKHPERAPHTVLDMYITGHDTSAYKERVMRAGLSDSIRFHAPLPARAIAAEMVRSDAALLFIPSGNRDLVGTKFHELFHLRIPVIHVGEPGLVQRTIEEHGLGVSLRTSEVASRLPDIMSGGEALPDPTRSTFDTTPYLLGALTDRLLNEVLA